MKGDFKVCKVSLKCIHKQIQENDFFLTNGNAKRIVKLTTVTGPHTPAAVTLVAAVFLVVYRITE